MDDGKFPVQEIPRQAFPALLREIPQPPTRLFSRGNLPPRDTQCLAVVGSRNYSNYGKLVVDYLIDGLRGHNIAIVSGLAIGIDTCAHEAALRNNLFTLAIPGSGLDSRVLYPRRNHQLARRILEAGGGLLSEFEPSFAATPWSFPQRNRIMAGLAHATLVIEASEKSGTLITARLTADYNRELLVVPGNIFSENSQGPHQFLKLGATPVTHPTDILNALGIAPASTPTSSALPINLTDAEQQVLSALQNPLDRDALIRAINLPAHEAIVVFMQLELTGHIKELNGVYYRT